MSNLNERQLIEQCQREIQSANDTALQSPDIDCQIAALLSAQLSTTYATLALHDSVDRLVTILENGLPFDQEGNQRP